MSTAAFDPLADDDAEQVQSLPLAAPATEQSGNPRQLIVAMGTFISCFATVGTLGALMPIIRQRLSLSPAEVGLVLAMPPLLGGIARIPVGVIADRIGGRAVFIGIMSLAILPAALMPYVHNLWQLLLCALFLGVPFAIFSVGVSFVSRWHPSHRQGTALGLLGLGNVGQVLALFGAPRLAHQFGFAWGFWTYAILLAVWLCVVILFSRNAPNGHAATPTWNDYLQPLGVPVAWALCLFYFLTFGGLTAMTSYLPQVLTVGYHWSPAAAASGAIPFVLLATSMRPVGGWLGDRVGGLRILLWVFPLVAAMALLMSLGGMGPFAVGVMGMALCIGIGNGAVFKLVAQNFPRTVGGITGIVGAAGALGGFFPPLAMGLIRQYTQSFLLGFLLLAAFSAACFLVCYAIHPKPLAPGEALDEASDYRH